MMRNGEAPIYFRITVNGQRAEFSTKRSIHPDHWDPTKGRGSKKTKLAISLNEYLDEVWNRIHEVRKQLEHEGKDITAQEVQERYLGKDTKRKKVLELYQEHNDLLKERIEKGVAYGTWERHRTSRTHFELFLLHKYRKWDIQASRISKSLLEEYYHYMITIMNCANNTSIKYLNESQ